MTRLSKARRTALIKAKRALGDGGSRPLQRLTLPSGAVNSKASFEQVLFP